jgi:hypothetical protein
MTMTQREKYIPHSEPTSELNPAPFVLFEPNMFRPGSVGQEYFPVKTLKGKGRYIDLHLSLDKYRKVSFDPIQSKYSNESNKAEHIITPLFGKSDKYYIDILYNKFRIKTLHELLNHKFAPGEYTDVKKIAEIFLQQIDIGPEGFLMATIGSPYRPYLTPLPEDFDKLRQQTVQKALEGLSQEQRIVIQAHFGLLTCIPLNIREIPIQQVDRHYYNGMSLLGIRHKEHYHDLSQFKLIPKSFIARRVLPDAQWMYQLTTFKEKLTQIPLENVSELSNDIKDALIRDPLSPFHNIDIFQETPEEAGGPTVYNLLFLDEKHLGSLLSVIRMQLAEKKLDGIKLTEEQIHDVLMKVPKKIETVIRTYISESEK